MGNAKVRDEVDDLSLYYISSDEVYAWNGMIFCVKNIMFMTKSY